MADLRASDSGHAAAGVLKRKDQRPFHVSTGSFKLFFLEAILGDVLELPPGDGQDLFGPGRRGPGVDGEQSGLSEHGVVAVHGVRQPALLPDLLEQPRRHAPSQGGVHDPEGEPVGIAARLRGGAEADMGLLGGPAANDRGAVRCGDPAGRPNLGAHAGRKAAPRVHLVLDQRAESILRHVAGHGDHEVRRPVQAPVEAVHLIPRDGGDRLFGAQDGPAQWMPGPQDLREDVVDQVVGSVLLPIDLLQDDLPLGFQVRRFDH